MKRKNFWLAMVTTFLFLSITASSWAVTELYVVRSSNDTLWKMTCTGLSCSSWTQITGTFSQQPTLTWDESISRYVLIGVSSIGTIWRSTFDVGGNFQNDWVQISGSSPSPVAAASGDFFESHVWYTYTGATTTILTTCTNYSGGYITLTPPRNGIVYVDADVTLYLNHVSGTQDYGDLFIGSTSTDCSSSYFTPFTVISAEPTGHPLPFYHVGEGFAVTGGVSYTWYLNGYMSSGQDAADYFYWGRMKAVFYPY